MTEDERRYLDACHAMQSGVAFRKDKSDQEPKHLRTGINSAMVSDKALTLLLVEKGIFTLEEFQKKLADCMEEEAKSYEQILEKERGIKVTLR
jgi:hypothetical protein